LIYLRLLGAQAAIGAAAIFARFALLGAGPLAVAALRLAIAVLPLLAVAAIMHPRLRIGTRRELAFAIAGLLLAAHFATWFASLLYTSVAISVLLVTTTPLWTALYESLVTRTLPTRARLVALGCATLGIALIALQHTAPAPVPGHALAGAVLAIGGAVALALYFIIVSAVGSAPKMSAPLPTSAIVARTNFWAALALLVAAAVTHQPPPLFADTRAWGGILALALVSQLLGHTAMNAALRNFTPSVVALTTLLEPPIAAALAALIFGEGLPVQTLAGGLAVLVGVGLVLRRIS
jgi:drug/metabolite transporter (DMT)-like permease